MGSILAALFLLHWFSSLTFIAAKAAAACKIVPPPNPNTTLCGTRGYPVTGPNLYSTGQAQIVSSLKECADVCARRRVIQKGPQHAAQKNPYSCVSHLLGLEYGYYDYEDADICRYCAGVLYDPKSGFCQLTSSSFDKESFQLDQKSDDIFYSFDCFDCGDMCDQPFNTPLLDNFRFKEQLFGPWNSIFEGTVQHGGSKSDIYRCDANSNREPKRDPYYRDATACWLQQGFNMCSYALYSLEFDYKIPDNTTLEKAMHASIPHTMPIHTIPVASYFRNWSRRATQSTTATKIYFRGPDRQYDNGPMDFKFYDYNLENGSPAIYKLSNVRIKSIPDELNPKRGAKPIPLNINGNIKSIKTTPGLAYLISANFTIEPHSTRGAYLRLEITTVRSASSYAKYFNSYDYYGTDESRSYSIPFRAESKVTSIAVYGYNEAILEEANIVELENQTI